MHTNDIHGHLRGWRGWDSDLAFEDGRISAHKRRLVTLDHTAVTSDAATTELIDSLEKPFRERLDEPLGEAFAVIPRAQTLAGQEPSKRDKESPADSLFGDLVRDGTPPRSLGKMRANPRRRWAKA